jgi:hypothetical protein
MKIDYEGKRGKREGWYIFRHPVEGSTDRKDVAELSVPDSKIQICDRWQFVNVIRTDIERGRCKSVGQDSPICLSFCTKTDRLCGWSEFFATDPEARVRFQALPEKKSNGSETGSTQPREYN